MYSVIFVAKMQNILRLKLLKCENLLRLSVFHPSELELFGLSTSFGHKKTFEGVTLGLQMHIL